jgi:hypothetical protein
MKPLWFSSGSPGLRTVFRPALAVVLAFAPLICFAAGPLIPTDDGMSWVYQMTQENAANATLDLEENPDKSRFDVSYRMGGRALLDGKDFLKLELYRGDTLASADFITLDKHGMVCSARMNEKGAVVKFDPPQTMLKTPVKTGTNWSFEGTVGDTKVSQQYQITGQENVSVPAGKFRAWRIHCDQTAPTAASIDRWFVPGTGFVKVMTTIRAPSGGLLQRTSLELKQRPKIAAAPGLKPVVESPKLSVGLSKNPIGEFSTTFASDTPKIYARWQGRGLRKQADIRVVWTAENVPGVATDYQIDEASTVAETPDSHGIFTLARPKGGWLPGNYSAEFYVDDVLTETVRVKIAK